MGTITSWASGRPTSDSPAPVSSAPQVTPSHSSGSGGGGGSSGGSSSTTTSPTPVYRGGNTWQVGTATYSGSSVVEGTGGMTANQLTAATQRTVSGSTSTQNLAGSGTKGVTEYFITPTGQQIEIGTAVQTPTGVASIQGSMLNPTGYTPSQGGGGYSTMIGGQKVVLTPTSAGITTYETRPSPPISQASNWINMIDTVAANPSGVRQGPIIERGSIIGNVQFGTGPTNYMYQNTMSGRNVISYVGGYNPSTDKLGLTIPSSSTMLGRITSPAIYSTALLNRFGIPVGNAPAEGTIKAYPNTQSLPKDTQQISVTGERLYFGMTKEQVYSAQLGTSLSSREAYGLNVKNLAKDVITNDNLLGKGIALGKIGVLTAGQVTTRFVESAAAPFSPADPYGTYSSALAIKYYGGQAIKGAYENIPYVRPAIDTGLTAIGSNKNVMNLVMTKGEYQREVMDIKTSASVRFVSVSGESAMTPFGSEARASNPVYQFAKAGAVTAGVGWTLPNLFRIGTTETLLPGTAKSTAFIANRVGTINVLEGVTAYGIYSKVNEFSSAMAGAKAEGGGFARYVAAGTQIGLTTTLELAAFAKGMQWGQQGLGIQTGAVWTSPKGTGQEVVLNKNFYPETTKSGTFGFLQRQTDQYIVNDLLKSGYSSPQHIFSGISYNFGRTRAGTIYGTTYEYTGWSPYKFGTSSQVLFTGRSTTYVPETAVESALYRKYLYGKATSPSATFTESADYFKYTISERLSWQFGKVDSNFKKEVSYRDLRLTGEQRNVLKAFVERESNRWDFGMNELSGSQAYRAQVKGGLGRKVVSSSDYDLVNSLMSGQKQATALQTELSAVPGGKATATRGIQLHVSGAEKYSGIKTKIFEGLGYDQPYYMQPVETPFGIPRAPGIMLGGTKATALGQGFVEKLSTVGTFPGRALDIGPGFERAKDIKDILPMGRQLARSAGVSTGNIRSFTGSLKVIYGQPTGTGETISPKITSVSPIQSALTVSSAIETFNNQAISAVIRRSIESSSRSVSSSSSLSSLSSKSSLSSRSSSSKSSISSSSSLSSRSSSSSSSSSSLSSLSSSLSSSSFSGSSSSSSSSSSIAIGPGWPGNPWFGLTMPALDFGGRRMTTPRSRKGKKKYVPSYEAFVWNIRGKKPKGTETGVRLRPIPKGFKWAWGSGY